MADSRTDAARQFKEEFFMGMVVRSNVMAMNAYRQLGVNNSSVAKSLEKLSSGYRINRAADDASGLAISEKMKAQIKGLEQASANSQDGISLIQTAEGATQEIHNMLNRMVELATKSANGTIQNEVDRDAIQKEVNDLNSEITRIAQSTNFNGINLLDGNLDPDADISLTASGKVGGATLAAAADGTYDLSGWATGDSIVIDGKTYAFDTDLATLVTAAGENGVTIDTTDDTAVTISKNGSELNLQVGDTNAEYNHVKVKVEDLSAKGVGTDDIDVSTQDAAGGAIQTIKDAINKVSTNRANLGSLQNRLEYTINNLDTTAENMTSANSRIRDTDMAKEMMNYTKMNILTQSAQAMLAQANQQPQAILQLLQ
jgi:flagellin